MDLSAQMAALKAENLLLREGKEELERMLALSQENVALLRFELDQLKRIVYGTKSERFEPASPDQLGLFQVSPPAAAIPLAEKQATTQVREAKKPVRAVLPSHLPRHRVVIEPDVDTTGMRKLGTEVSETLDYQPPKIIVIRRERPKYVATTGEIIIAELPARPIEKGIAEAGLLAHTVVSKYEDHLPLFRQARMLARQGITVSESTLGGWVSQTADLLTPLYDELARQARASGYIQADETPIKVQDSDKPGATHRGWYWVYHAPEQGVVVMDYQKGRGRAGPATWLGPDYDGLLQCDGYGVYDQFVRATLAGCWAHARRHFHDAKDSAAERAESVLVQIGELYDIERRLREEEASPEERARQRQEMAMPVLTALKAFLTDNPGLPKSPWGKAVNYTLTRWDKLTRYVHDGRLEIDNNLVENAIRPIALGRKNYLFAGSHDAAQRSAVIYSLLATCKKHSVNPQAWMADVLARIPTHPSKRVEELLPNNWEQSNV